MGDGSIPAVFNNKEALSNLNLLSHADVSGILAGRVGACGFGDAYLPDCLA
jgi:hypothetical protein